MKKNYKWILIGGIAIIGAIVIWKSSQPKVAAPYITTEVIQKDLQENVLATGTIDASKSVDVGAQVSGQIKKLYVKLGQTVTKGDPIADIDAVTQENNLLDAQASLENYQAQLTSKQVTVEKSQIAYDRESILYTKEAASKEDLDTARVTLASAVADVALIKSQIKQAQVSLSQAKVNLGYTKIVSPISGIIVSVPVNEGQTVNANQTTPTLVKIAQLDTVTIKAEIAEGDVIKVKPGQDVSFTVLGDSQTIYHSTLKSIDPGPQSLSDSTSTTSSASSTTSSSSSSSSGTAIYYYGIFDVPNPDKVLRISMTAQVTIILKDAKNALIIPSSALKKENGKYYVRVQTAPNTLEKREVTVGINTNLEAQILTGLKVGDLVVVSQASSEDKTDLSKRPMRI